jgi:hypothetical protein
VTRERTLRFSARLPTPPERTWALWLQHLWVEGAGLGPRPLVEVAGGDHGLGCTRRVGGAAGVREAIVAVDYPRSLEYRVLNPSWRTYPVDAHRGCVRFEPLAGGGCLVQWSVSYRPKRGAALLVVMMTRFVIGHYLRRLRRLAR